MQGQSSSVSALHENLSFDHGSTSSDACIQTSSENRLPEYRITSSGTHSQYLHHVRPEGLDTEWSLGESSSQSRADPNERKREHTWSVCPQPSINLEEHQHESSGVLSLDNIDVDQHGTQTANVSPLSMDLDMFPELSNFDGNACQAIEHSSRHVSVRSSNEKMPSTVDDSDYRPGCSLDNRQISCKRKALEMHVGQSSGEGSSNCFEHFERRQWHAQNDGSNVNKSTRAEHDVDFSVSEQANSGSRSGIRGAVSPNHFSTSARETAESLHRNVRLRINSSYQEDHVSGILFPTEANVGHSDVPSSWHSSRLLLHNRLFNLNPTPPSENEIHHNPSVLPHVPSLHRNPQSRWTGASSSRNSNPSTSSISMEREADAMLYDESTPRRIPRSTLEHLMFVPPSEIGNSSEQSMNWNDVTQNVASPSRVGTTPGVNSSSPSWAHRRHPLNPRRLSEIVRRSLLPSVGSEPGGQSGNVSIRSSSSGPSQEMDTSLGSSNHGHNVTNSRSSLLDRHPDGALGVPHSLRSLDAASEGRSSIMSEQIRHVLDLMRRGESLRIEDMMILDHSAFLGMADVFDRHRDMRMDVDNMSYEELVALEERIGNVCTGLNEETIITLLKLRKYGNKRAEDELQTEPCSICREEYNNGEDIGTLECGHGFHRDCIKQWLMHKNLCPICKMTGLVK